MSYGIGGRFGSDSVLLWPRPAAVALIRPPAWELPYALGEALKAKKKKEKRKKKAHGSVVIGKSKWPPLGYYDTLIKIKGSRSSLVAQQVKNPALSLQWLGLLLWL